MGKIRLFAYRKRAYVQNLHIYPHGNVQNSHIAIDNDVQICYNDDKGGDRSSGNPKRHEIIKKSDSKAGLRYAWHIFAFIHYV